MTVRQLETVIAPLERELSNGHARLDWGHESTDINRMSAYLLEFSEKRSVLLRCTHQE